MFAEKYEELKSSLKPDQNILVRSFCVSLASLKSIGEVRRRGLVYYSTALGQGFNSPLHCCSRDIQRIQEDKRCLTDEERDELIEILKIPPILYLNANSNGPKQFDFADRLLSAGVRFSFSVAVQTWKVTGKGSPFPYYEKTGSKDVINFSNFNRADKAKDNRHDTLFNKWLNLKQKGEEK